MGMGMGMDWDGNRTNPPIMTTFSSLETEHFPTGFRCPDLISFSVPRI